MKHFYQNVPGWFNYHQTYRDMVELCPNNGTIVELGSYLGASIAYLCVEAVNSGKDINIWAIDAWPDHVQWQGQPIWDVFRRNVEPLAAVAKFHVFRSDSAAAAAPFPDGSVHSVFVDADHRQPYVTRDLMAWWPKWLGPATGIFAGHDYDERTPGVRAALLQFIKDHPEKPEIAHLQPCNNEGSLYAGKMPDICSWMLKPTIPKPKEMPR